MKNNKVIVVDGSNVAHIELSEKGNPKVSNITAVRQELENQGYDPIVIVDASLRHRIDDPKQLESLIDSQKVRQAPAGTDADFFVLQIAEEHKAEVVSNDQFQDYRKENPWIENRRVPLMIVRGAVELSKHGKNS